MSNSPKLPVPMWGNLNAREHAIDGAHQWQLAHLSLSEDDQEREREVYGIIVDLLVALNVGPDELQRIARKKALPSPPETLK